MFPALFDVLPAGERAIVHELVLLPSPALSGWTLVAAPSAGFGGHHVVVPGEPFRFSTKYGTQLYACRAEETIPDALSAEWMTAHRPTPIPVLETRSVSLLSPLQRLTTRLEVDGIGPTRVSLHVVDEQRVNAFPGGVLWVGLGAIAALGLFGLVLLRRGRRARATRKGSSIA